jgi:hypothetical protein
MALLRRGDLSVTEVCFTVGCASLGTFSTRFTELVGVSPSVYRQEAAGATAGMPSCVSRQVTRPIREHSTSGQPVARGSSAKKSASAKSIRNQEAPTNESELA